jgi:putative tryptophan/tyrosine transport system substrate-binding protein
VRHSAVIFGCLALRSLFAAAVLCSVLPSATARADQLQAIHRIGVLMPALMTAPEEGLRQGLRELGYVEGRDMFIEWRRSAGTAEELRSIAANLAGTNVELIVTVGAPASRAALDATSLPVVFAPLGDPVGTGFAASLSRPGGRGTGVAVESTELIAKRLELLRLAVPRARRIVFLMNSANPIMARQLEAVQTAARALGVTLVPLDARNAGELEVALHTISLSEAGGVLVPADLLFLTYKTKIAQTMRRARLSAMVSLKEYHADGVLMSYGVNLREAMHRASVYVDKILKGTKPSEIPIEQVSKFELVIDLRVAKEIGITVPQDLLLRADEVIR